MNTLIPRQSTVLPYRDIYATMGLIGEDSGFHYRRVPVPLLLQVRPVQPVPQPHLRQPVLLRLRQVQLLHQRLQLQQRVPLQQRVQQVQLVQPPAQRHRQVQVLVQQQRYRYA